MNTRFFQTWKKLFGVLREMPGFKDQNVEVCAYDTIFAFFYYRDAFSSNFVTFVGRKYWKVRGFLISKPGFEGLCNTPKKVSNITTNSLFLHNFRIIWRTSYKHHDLSHYFTDLSLGFFTGVNFNFTGVKILWEGGTKLCLTGLLTGENFFSRYHKVL